MKHFIVFGNPFDFATRALERYPGCEVTLVIERHLRYKVNESDEIGHVFEVSGPWSDLNEITEGIKLLPAVTHVVALVDHLMPLAARYARHAGLVFHSEQTVNDITDKSAMRRRLKGVPELAVGAEIADSYEAFQTALSKIGFPLVVKPLNSTGSLGVTVLRRGDDALAAWQRAHAVSEVCVIEEYLEGAQYSVEAFTENRRHVILAVTRKFSDPVTLVELGHVLPAALSPDEYRLFVKRTTQLLDRVGLEYGPSHTEFVLTGRGPRPIETHARVGGDDIYLMVKDATQVDMDALQIEQVFGDSVADSLVPFGGCPQAIWFGASETGTRCLDATTVDVSGQGNLTWLLSGDIPPLRSSADRAFQVRSAGLDPDDALERARSASAKVARASGLTESYACLQSML